MAFVASSSQSHFNLVEFARRTYSTLLAAHQRQAVYRTTKHELMALSDSNLSDLGIVRGDINRVALEAAIGSAH